MSKKMILIVLGVMIFAVSLLPSCMPAETDSEEQLVLEGQGIVSGMVDNHSVEILINGEPKVFQLSGSIEIADLVEGREVKITYMESAEQLVLQSLELIELPVILFSGEGFYIGQIDSHSVEIEVAGMPRAFAIGESVRPDDIPDGSAITFTYSESGERPLLVSVDSISPPEEQEELSVLSGTGVFTGQIDSRSVEIFIERTFKLAEGLTPAEIEEGALIAFTFEESETGAIINSLEVVDEPKEGEFMHGTLVDQPDLQSLVIKYYQAFELGRTELSGIEDGSSVYFTYQPGEYRPVLQSISLR